jgi:ATP-dependent DNA ligase
MIILVSKDNKGKIRVVYIDYHWSDEKHGFVIERTTSQYGGKETTQPEIWIFKGKASRTLTEQVKLEFNSHLKKYQDKGYKILPNTIDINDSKAVSKFVKEQMADGITDSHGFRKHMLAKQADKVATSVFDKLPYWYASRKIDGVRASFYLKDGHIVTASRGGNSYDYSTHHFTDNPEFIKFFENHPDIVLDGELYKHGKSLQQISGAARMEVNAVDCDWLEYYIYDVMDGSKTFKERLEVLDTITEELHLGFDPNREWNKGELQIQMVPQEKVTGWLNIQKLHDKYVEEGFEGVVIRDPSKVYNFGGRTNAMIKVKHYKDDEFLIIDYKEGLRPIEDMTFVCQTEEGVQFEAKPMGSREVKQDYFNNMDSIIGKMATVKYFYLSDEGCPLQPVLKCIRDYE